MTDEQEKEMIENAHTVAEQWEVFVAGSTGILMRYFPEVDDRQLEGLRVVFYRAWLASSMYVNKHMDDEAFDERFAKQGMEMLQFMIEQIEKEQ